jgi:hypothetical protein
MCRTIFSLGGLLLSAAVVYSQAPKPELLPMPKPIEGILPTPRLVVEMGPLGPVLPGYFHPDPYAHWKFYAVDKQGFFKPRVVFAPQPYYLYNGQPYYFLRVLPQDMSTDPRPR